MAKLVIRTVPDPVLREKARRVETIDGRIRKLLRDMLETMYEDDGIGLAANQVGILERLLVIDISEKRDGSEALMMVNPEILWSSEEMFTYKEGCLSVRPCATETAQELYADVTRPAKIRVSFLDEYGEPQEIVAEELLSQCIQHEIDHLDGVLFFDHISALRRGMMLRKIDKLRRMKQDGKTL